MSTEEWHGATGVEVHFTATAFGIVLVERDALALLLVAAGFEQVAP